MKKSILFSFFLALMATMTINAQEANVVNLADVANYIDFQALSVSDPAMTQHTVTSTDPYELANGTKLVGRLRLGMALTRWLLARASVPAKVLPSN